jgi:ferredoxin
MSKTFLLFLLTICLLEHPTQSTNHKIACLTKHLLKSLKLSNSNIKAVTNNLIERNAYNQNDLSHDDIDEVFDLIDMNLFSDFTELLGMVDYSMDMQLMLKKCKVNLEATKERCEQRFGEQNCQMVNPISYTKKCEEGYEQFGSGYCIPQCPVGFLSLDHDPFVCLKSSTLKRSLDFEQLAVGEHKHFSYRRGIAYLTCPGHTSNIGFDFCLEKCPEGWADLVSSCRKPMIKKHQFDLFVYDPILDDYLSQPDVETEDL